MKLEELTMKIINEETARIGEFENGGIDVVPVSTAEWVEKLDQNKDYVKKVVSFRERSTCSSTRKWSCSPTRR